MLVRTAHWDIIREDFTQAEKDTLNESIVGEVICPRGIVIDEQKAGAVADKIKQLTKNLPRETR